MKHAYERKFIKVAYTLVKTCKNRAMFGKVVAVHFLAHLFW